MALLAASTGSSAAADGGRAANCEDMLQGAKCENLSKQTSVYTLCCAPPSSQSKPKKTVGTAPTPSMECKAAPTPTDLRDAEIVAVPAAKYRIKGSCETRAICVIDVVCRTNNRSPWSPTSAACLANSDGKCPAPQDCAKNSGLSAEVAEIAPESHLGQHDGPPESIPSAGSPAFDPGSVRK
jgi:hypothetical protein